MAKFRMSEAQIARFEKFRLIDRLGEDIGKISLKNYKLDSDNAIAKELFAMPKYKVFSLRSMRRYVTETIKGKILDLEWDRRIDELPAGSNWPAKDLETFRYEAARLELLSSKEYRELFPKEFEERAMQRAKRPQS
jgi:hypothetical protein